MEAILIVTKALAMLSIKLSFAIGIMVGVFVSVNSNISFGVYTGFIVWVQWIIISYAIYAVTGLILEVIEENR